MKTEDETIVSSINLLRKDKEWADNIENVKKTENIILNLTDKNLKNHLYIILPCILDILNNFAHKFRGINLLDYLLDKLSYLDFKLQGYDNLIIFSVKNLFYHQEEEVYKIIFDLAKRIFIKFKFNPMDKTKVITELDDIINIVLNQIEIGTNDNLRLICLDNLKKILTLLDKAIYKFLTRLIEDCLYLIEYDFIPYKTKFINSSLDLLEYLIELTGEVNGKYMKLVLIHLMKLLYCLDELENKQDFEITHQKTFNCIFLLKKSNNSLYNEYITYIQKKKELNKLSKLIQINFLSI